MDTVSSRECMNRLSVTFGSATDKSQSGLGLQAQRHVVAEYARHLGGVVVSEFVEVESGGPSDRPQLAQRQRLVNVSGLASLSPNSTDSPETWLSFQRQWNLAFPSLLSITLMPTSSCSTCSRPLRSMDEMDCGLRQKAALAVAKTRGVVLGWHGRKVLSKKPCGSEGMGTRAVRCRPGAGTRPDDPTDDRRDEQ